MKTFGIIWFYVSYEKMSLTIQLSAFYIFAFLAEIHLASSEFPCFWHFLVASPFASQRKRL